MIIIFICVVQYEHDDNVNVKVNVKHVHRFYNYITWPKRRKLKIMRAFISHNGDWSEERSSRLLNGEIVLIIKSELIAPRIILLCIFPIFIFLVEVCNMISIMRWSTHFFFFDIDIDLSDQNLFNSTEKNSQIDVFRKIFYYFHGSTKARYYY